MYRYGLIGNCQAAALVRHDSSVDWLCLPRPDSPPVFGSLLDPDGGSFRIDLLGLAGTDQRYLENTTILETTLRAQDGSTLKVTDFCPRFPQHGRMYRPNALFRIVEPISGSPSIRVLCQPVQGWDKTPAKATRGNNHLRYEIAGDVLRVLTNMPLTYLSDDVAFAVKEPIYFALTWGFGIEDDLARTTNSFLEQTAHYWRTWVKHCSIPSLYQAQTIRSALTLKLHCYEDTGAILAALTTSLPEEVGQTRNWDYRYCWLRDAYYVLSAFHNLGHFEEMEGFLTFLLNIAEKHEHSREKLRPVYCLDQTLPLPELTHSNWRGFANTGPVRSGNQAAEHIQNDVYGEMILTLAPIFFDDRFQYLRTKDHEALLQHLSKLCAQNISKPDAGLWEIRDGWQEHSFSNLMCWAGLERIERIRDRGYLKGIPFDLAKARQQAEDAVRKAVREGIVRNGPADETLDSALLQLPILRYPGIDVSQQTIRRIRADLSMVGEAGPSSFLYRYLRQDDFGRPKSAFLICSFWLVQALAKVGDLAEARKVMSETIAAANSLGLFSEHFVPSEGGQVGNFPQAYSHVGQINAAFAVSPDWSEVL